MTVTEDRPLTWDHLRSRKKPRTRTIPIALDPELAEELDDVRSRVDVLKIRTASRPEDDEAQEEFVTKQAELEQLMERAKEDIVSFKVRSIGRKNFERLVLDNQPTDKQREEAKRKKQELPNWNPDTFQPILVAACLVEPKMTLEETRELWDDDNWSASETYVLFMACLDVNSNHRNANLGKG